MKLGEKCDLCGLCAKKEDKTDVGQYADPCMGILPGVLYGCCGHGESGGYLFFKNGVTIRFEQLETVEHQTYNRHHSFIQTEAEG